MTDHGSCWCCGQHGIVTPAISALGMCASCRGRSPAACQRAHQKQAWQRAEAAKARGKRNQRGKRPAPPVTGIRINPGGSK